MSIIQQHRINNINRFEGLLLDRNIAFGVRATPDLHQILANAGFTLPLSPGEAVVPRATFGPVSRYNAEGRPVVCRELPMEIVHRPRMWTRQQWNGRHDTTTVTDLVYVRYRRYPRSFDMPPCVEMVVKETLSGEIVIATRSYCYPTDDTKTVLHAINLVLEVFGSCEFFDANLNPLLGNQVRRLNWDILPRGRCPWGELQKDLSKLTQHLSREKSQLASHRFTTMHRYNPEFIAVGRGGFTGYVVFGFPDKTLFALESIYTGNATYVFGQSWEELSQMTKADVLNANVHERRLIHTKGWEQEVHGLLG